MNIPAELRYTNEHIWVRVEGGEAVVGITDFAQSELGDIVYVEVETEGETLAQEAIFGTVEAVKTVSDLFLPVSGEIIAFNKKLDDNPELINTDPYGEGWIVRVKMKNSEEFMRLLTDEAYKNLIGA